MRLPYAVVVPRHSSISINSRAAILGSRSSSSSSISSSRSTAAAAAAAAVITSKCYNSNNTGTCTCLWYSIPCINTEHCTAVLQFAAVLMYSTRTYKSQFLLTYSIRTYKSQFLCIHSSYVFHSYIQITVLKCK